MPRDRLCMPCARFIEREKFNSNRENIEVHVVNLDVISIGTEYFLYNECEPLLSLVCPIPLTGVWMCFERISAESGCNYDYILRPTYWILEGPRIFMIGVS